MTEWIGQLTTDAMHYIQNVEPMYAYLILMVASVTENVFPPAPGDAITIFGASLVGTGYLSFFWVLVATTIGSTIGFMAYYYVGSVFGQRFLEGRGKKLIPPEALEKADLWFKKYGFKLILANRFLAGIRSVISFFCGLSKLSVPKVLFFATLSAILWNSILISAGAFVGKNWEQISGYVQTYAQVITVLLLVIAVIFFIRKRLQKQVN